LLAEIVDFEDCDWRSFGQFSDGCFDLKEFLLWREDLEWLRDLDFSGWVVGELFYLTQSFEYPSFYSGDNIGPPTTYLYGCLGGISNP